MTPKKLFIFILLILILLGIIFLWLPKYQDFSALNSKVKEKKIELQNKEEYFSDLSQLSRKLKEEYSSEIAKIDFALPSDLSIFELLKILEKESSQNGLILKNFDINLKGISSLKETAEIREIPINLSLSGSYSAFKNFLSALQKNARMFEAKLISFSSEKEGGEVFNFDLLIKAYSY